MGGQRYAPDALFPGRLGGPQIRCARVSQREKESLAATRVFHPLAGRCVDYAVSAPTDFKQE
jgi:hypothetical protein